MPDYVSIAERALKAVRYGFFSVNDQLALALDGLCRIPEPPRVDYQDGTEKLDPDYEYDYCGASSPYTDVTCIKPAGHEGQHKCFDKLWNVWDTSSPAVEFPPAAVADSTPEAAVSGGSEEIDAFPRVPSEPHPDEAVIYEMTMQRMERLESGAWLGFSDDYPGKQFLIVLRPGFEK